MNRANDDAGGQPPAVALSLQRSEGDIFPDLVKLPEHGPVVRIPLGEGHAWVVSDPVLVRMATSRRSSSYS